MTPSQRSEEPSAPRAAFPKPTVTPVSQYFWDNAHEHHLVYQRCERCHSVVFPPRAHCPACWATSLRWHESSGHGALASTAIVHRAGHPAFAPLVPYRLALVDLDEGFRMLSRIAAGPEETTPVGMRLRVWWEHNGEVTLPLFVGAERRT